MIYTQEDECGKELCENHKDNMFKELKVDCEKCFGLCCTALYFSACEGFPTNKEAGIPCINLQEDFRCSVHKNLLEKGLKGCMAYDCFGAGQKIAQVTYEGYNWRHHPELMKQMFEVFLVVRQLHEMMWYLSEALTLNHRNNIKDRLNLILSDTYSLTLLKPNSLLELDLEAHRDKVNSLLFETSELVRSKILSGNNTTSKYAKNVTKRYDFFGADLRKTNLRGANLRGACLIAANLRGVDLSGADLIGADLRDTNLSGANLMDSIFVTQAQINAAIGDSNTKLSRLLARPKHWKK
jgi:uncharacterized protein YjbI with pentapeptide repeats